MKRLIIFLCNIHYLLYRVCVYTEYKKYWIKYYIGNSIENLIYFLNKEGE